MAERAYQEVFNRFWDEREGGAFWRLDGTGRMLDDSKKIYGQAFYIYAMAEYHRAFSVPEAAERAWQLFELVERHAHDPVHGGYWEVRRRDWSEARDARLSERDMAEAKSMNNHLHLLEAYTNLLRLRKSDRVAERLRELIGLFDRHILDPRTRHLHHFFNEAWEVRSDTYTFGHDIEASWLLCEAAEVLGDQALLRHLRSVALRMAAAVVQEGVDVDGALCYEGEAGRVLDRGKECWPQAEALIGFLNAYQISGQPECYRAAQRIWEFIEQHLTDRVHGEWYWRITPEGRPDPALPKVSEWKGPYHGTRACLEAGRRLKEIAKKGAASDTAPV